MHSSIASAIVIALLGATSIDAAAIGEAPPRDCSKLFEQSHAPGYNWSEALDLANCMLTKTGPFTNCLFYTSNASDDALQYAKDQKNKGIRKTLVYDVYSKLHFDDSISPMREWNKSNVTRDVYRITSKAFALACSGTAEVVIPIDQDACPRSIWLTDEYEVIRNGESKITLPVYRVGWNKTLSKWVPRELSTDKPSRVKSYETQHKANQVVLERRGRHEHVSGGRESVEPAPEWGGESKDSWAIVHGGCGKSVQS